MGTHGKKGLIVKVLGSVAEEVTREASCLIPSVKMPWAEPRVAVPYTRA